MAEPLKNMYNDKFFNELSKVLYEITPDFNKNQFISDIYDNEWENRELKQRMRHTSTVIKDYLAQDYSDSINQLLEIVNYYQIKNEHDTLLGLIFIPDFVEQYGLDNFEISIPAIEKITQLISCEFAIRPFIIKHEKQTMQQMSKWSKHENHHVRRLASEGCRPRLPWAMAIPNFKKDPSLVLPILEILKGDSSEYVRRSVANNLNDISKDNPSTVIEIAKKWHGANDNTDKIVKHACRTLLKQGNTGIMELFGFESIKNIEISDFEITTKQVKIGSFAEFHFKLANKSKLESKIRLEYAVYYQKANGTLSKKVFKISERIFQGETETTIIKKHSFRLITTRKFHTGEHKISVIINGNEIGEESFKLIQH